MSSSSDDDDKKLVRSSDSDSESEKRHRKKKKSKDKSKHKKHKKHSKKHKKHKRHRSTSSESSDSEEEQWVSKEEIKVKSTPKTNDDSLPTTKPEFLKPPVERDEWMTMEGLLPTFSNDSKRAKRQKEKEEARTKSSIEQLGQTSVELNPYWKNGGTGLPTEEPLEKQQALPTSILTPVGDGGIYYLKKQFQRAKEQAAEEGRSLEEIAAERWGSLENFFHMLEEAEEKAKYLDKKRSESDDSRHNNKSRDYNRHRRHRDDNDDDNNKSERYHSRNSSHRNERFQRPRGSDSDEDNHDKFSNSRDRYNDDNRSSDYKSSDRRDRDRDRRSYREDDYKSRIPTSSSSSSGGWRKPESKSSSSATTVTSYETNTIQLPPNKIPKLNEKIQDIKTHKQEDEEEQEQEQNEEENEQVKLLSENEMNQLCAKILKAEIMGNQTLIESLKAQKEAAEKAKKEHEERGGGRIQEKKKIVVKVILDEQKGAGPRRKIKEKPGETHNKEGQRVRYFPDDDRQSLKNMFESEKRNTVENENALFSRLAGKSLKSTNEDYDLDDIFADKASSSKQSMKEKEREVKDILYEEKMYKKTLENCPWCFEGNKLSKNLVISVAEKSILCLPPYQSLTEGHCLIIPYSHASCATQLDEDVWEEIQKFRKALVKMFADSDQDVVFFESALFLKKSPHMYLECVPMPKEIGELAPIYFKKAIQECETEWAQNKKLIELKDRDVRRAVPKGLPYFSVDFGYDNGFAHVIEDEKNFPRNFAQEILGGMMELEHGIWRKQKQDDFKTQRNKVMNFLKLWGPYDWTR